MKTKLKSNRTFGVEVEFTTGIGRCELATQLQDATGQLVLAENYNHATRPHWKMVHDGSCGHELVSPILQGQNDLEKAKAMIKALSRIDGVKVNKRCGLHVHVGVQDMPVRNLTNIVKLYAKYETEIDKVMQPTRRKSNNYYAASIFEGKVGMRQHDHDGDFTSNWAYNDATTGPQNNHFKWLWKKLNACTQGSEIQNILGGTRRAHCRYVKTNFYRFRELGTCEFRQHGASLNPNKIAMWICFLTNLCDKAAKANGVQITKDARTAVNFARCFGAGQSRRIVEYFEARAVYDFGFDEIDGAYDYATGPNRLC